MVKVRIRLRELLAKNDLRQKDLSEMTGIRQSAISEMCRNERFRVEIDHINRIANALNITDIREIIDLIDE